jgi:hypothetical protein
LIFFFLQLFYLLSVFLQILLFFFLFFRHRGIFNFSPFEAQFETHIFSHIARRNAIVFSKRDEKARSIFIRNNRSIGTLKIGDSVLLRTKRGLFQKESSVVNPTYNQQVYTITNIDFSVFPPLFSLSHFHGNPPKRYYRFELKLVPKQFYTADQIDRNVYVQDFRVVDQTRLRSGLLLPNTGKIQYKITSQGQEERWVDYTELKKLKQLLNSDLVYNSLFNTDNNRKYVI